MTTVYVTGQNEIPEIQELKFFGPRLLIFNFLLSSSPNS